MEQFAQKRGYASLRYDQSSTGQTTGVKREDVSCKNKLEKYSNYIFIIKSFVESAVKCPKKRNPLHLIQKGYL